MGVLRNRTTGAVVANAVCRAATPWQRLVGLIGAKDLGPEGGLWLQPCSSVHTIGMRFPIDVVMLDRAGRVLAIAPNVPPLRPLIAHRRAAIVVELQAGMSAQRTIRVGDDLDLIP